MQEFIGCTEFPVYAPFSTRHWRRQVPLFHNVSNAIGPPATAHPFDVLLELDHWVYFPFAFGRSTRSSRNSVGPLVRRRRRCARSSGGAEGSIIFSIAFVASSRARNRRPDLLTGLVVVLTSRPSSTRRRMASERPVSLAAAHDST